MESRLDSTISFNHFTHAHSLYTHHLPTIHSFIHAFKDAKINLNLTV